MTDLSLEDRTSAEVSTSASATEGESAHGYGRDCVHWTITKFMETGKVKESTFKSAAALKTKHSLFNPHRTTIRYVEDGVELRAKRSFARTLKPLLQPIGPAKRELFRRDLRGNENTPSLPEDEIEKFIPVWLPGSKRMWKYRGASHSLARRDVFDSSEIAFWSIRNKSPC